MPVTVNWTPRTTTLKNKITGSLVLDPGLQLLFSPPEPFYAYLKTKRCDSPYLKCYALIDYFKNAYIIKAPFDLTIKLNRETNWLSVDGITQDLYDRFVLNRADQCNKADPALLSLPPSYIFYADTPVVMTSLPLPLLGEPHNTRSVPGKFDISKWVRPIDWTIEIVDSEKEIVIRRDDPLFMVMFDTPNNDKVVLNRVPLTVDLLELTSACTEVKNKIKNLPLQKCYELAESFLAMWRKYRKD